uniref:TF-B3 domain-containing protein n=1 Tax=Setaria italica TaxID=4555 RepID=K3YE69_SETIT
MASSGPGKQGTATAKKHLRVLLPFSRDALRIPDELAGEIGAAEALVVGPAGGKVKFWSVEVGKDGDGAFLGRGWPEFAEACGVGTGWLVLRHRGRGVLSAKAFDATCCFRELGAPAPPAGEATASSKGSTHKPQFIRVLPKDFMEKMLIPAKFVEQHIPMELLDNRTAIVFGRSGKVYSIKLEMGWTGVFLAGGWSQFLKFHDITEANALLLRYEGNMVFTLKVYGPNGYQREFNHKKTEVDKEQHETPFTSSSKRKSRNESLSSDDQNKQKGSMASLKNASSCAQGVYVIGPPAWLKEISTRMIKICISFPAAFCNAIGLREACTVTLKTSLSSTSSWQVRVLPYKDTSHQVGSGWKSFCEENMIKEGDVCTFNVIEMMLWHVVIDRC